MHKSFNVLLGLVVGSMFLTACGGGGGKPGSSETKSTVTVGIGDAFQQTYNLDPYERPTSGELNYTLSSTYERLADLDASGNLVPKLATKWTPTDDGQTWTYELRDNVKFHSGKDFSAQDVVWSFTQMLDPANKLAVTEQFGAFLKPEGVTALDAKTVQFKLTKPVVDFPTQISLMEAVIIPDGVKPESLREKVDGTGPFTVKGWSKGAKTLKLTRFDGYWGEKAKTAEIDLQEMVDTTARTSALVGGQVDVITNIDLATVKSLQKNDRVRLVDGPPAISITMEMLVDVPPFNDPNVRKALKMVLDRQYLVDTVMLGYAVAGSDQPIPPTSDLVWSKDVPQQDIAGAKAALAASGYGPDKPLKVDLYAAEIQPGAMSIAQAYKEMAAKAGIEINIQTPSLDQYWDAIWMKKPFYMDSWGVRPPTQALPFAYGCKPTYDATHWCNQDYEAVMTKAQSTVDGNARNELLKQAQELINADGGVITAVYFKNLVATSPKCEGFVQPVPFYQVDWTKLTCAS
jgi:peptide/nickel transport system substrate-binding protein